MNKQQMAEWLAEEVLGWKYCGECDVVVRPNIPNEPDEPPMLNDFIYSPDGFFAVWDAVEKKDWYFKMIPSSPHYEWVLCHLYEKDNRAFKIDNLIQEGIGKDRYEAFYNAVYEAMNERVENV